MGVAGAAVSAAGGTPQPDAGAVPPVEVPGVESGEGAGQGDGCDPGFAVALAALAVARCGGALAGPPVAARVAGGGEAVARVPSDESDGGAAGARVGSDEAGAGALLGCSAGSA